MRPVSDYAAPRPGLAYGAYVAAAQRAGHLAIGYRTSPAGVKDLTEAIHLDPPKSAVVDLQPDDRIVVVVRRDGGDAVAAVGDARVTASLGGAVAGS